MRQLKIIIFAALLLSFSNSITDGQSNRSKRGRIRIVGTVVAYDYLAPLFSLTCCENSALLVVRVEKRSRRMQESRYIKVDYIFWPERANNQINEGTRKWRFRLKRERGCDGPLREVLFMKTVTESGVEGTEARLKWINGEEEKKVSADLVLRCYTLHTTDIKPL